MRDDDHQKWLGSTLVLQLLSLAEAAAEAEKLFAKNDREELRRR